MSMKAGMIQIMIPMLSVAGIMGFNNLGSIIKDEAKHRLDKWDKMENCMFCPEKSKFKKVMLKVHKGKYICRKCLNGLNGKRAKEFASYCVNYQATQGYKDK